VFVSADGRVVTNHHVIERAASADVRLPDGSTYNVVGILIDDPVRDLCVLKVAGNNFRRLRLRTDLPEVGDDVLALGSPLGLEATVSSGIVSSVRREETGVRYIQTTAPISPGSSGGALVDLQGRLLGITTFGYTSGQNLNFAVSALDLADLLRIAPTYAEPFHPTRELRINDVTDDAEILKLFGSPKRSGWSSESGHERRYYVYDDLVIETLDNVVVYLTRP
jgi:S1-C subfamily serine protease